MPVAAASKGHVKNVKKAAIDWFATYKNVHCRVFPQKILPYKEFTPGSTGAKRLNRFAVWKKVDAGNIFDRHGKCVGKYDLRARCLAGLEMYKWFVHQAIDVKHRFFFDDDDHQKLYVWPNHFCSVGACCVMRWAMCYLADNGNIGRLTLSEIHGVCHDARWEYLSELAYAMEQYYPFLLSAVGSRKIDLESFVLTFPFGQRLQVSE